LLLLIDNYDSFTYNLFDYFKQLHQEILVIKNDELTLSQIENLNFSGIVISPGPGVPKNSGNLMNIIDHWHYKIPMLGICLGHQALGTYFGCKLIKSPTPMHGKISKIATKFHPMWANIPLPISVCRYHSLSLQILSDNILPTASSMDDNMNMAFAHKNLPIWGIQFHPEAILTEHGMVILNNWLNSFILH
jgi:anthranilate synthase component 2